MEDVAPLSLKMEEGLTSQEIQVQRNGFSPRASRKNTALSTPGF